MALMKEERGVYLRPGEAAAAVPFCTEPSPTVTSLASCCLHLPATSKGKWQQSVED